MSRTAVLGALSCALALAPAALGASREVRKTAPAKDGMVVEVENLAGTVRLVPASGAEVEVVARLVAEGSSASESEKLLALLDVAFEANGDRVTAKARYPVDEYSTIHYPDPRRHEEEHGLLSLFGSSRSTVRYQGRRVTVVSGRRKSAPTLFADFEVRVPRGVAVSVHEAAGFVTGGDLHSAVKVDGDAADVKLRGTGGVRIHTGSGDVVVRDVDGEARLDTGSGDVTLDGAKGAVELRTGSGDVKAFRVEGDVVIGTGSGDASLTDVAGKLVRITTGSGTLTLDHVTGALELSTGSGDVHGRALGRAESLVVDSGSGNVSLEGDLSDAREIRLGTSSGDVELWLARALPMRLVALTSSGEIDVDVADVRTVRKSEHELVAEVGSASTPVRIETSSGNLRVSAR
jgi:DUF4097 and DUF4098 domain-containing protein YvlB